MEANITTAILPPAEHGLGRAGQAADFQSAQQLACYLTKTIFG
jgi:hypothetical protein